jgi:pyrimidine-specific ribonucleoside hydrolase
MSTAIILDCDPGHDDAIALLLALASPEVDLLCVTTVHGNQTLARTTDNALRVLDLAGRADIPVAAGADRPLARELTVASHVHGESGLDGPSLRPASRAPLAESAVDLMARTIAASPVPVTLIPTGPLTNVAQLLERTAGANVGHIVLMGGAIAEGNMTPAAEFNIWADPEAAQAVFHAGIDLCMIGLDVTHRALTTPALQDRLRRSGQTGAFVAELVDFFTLYHRETYGWNGAPIHDAVAVAHVIRPGIVTTTPCNVEIECDSELCRGRTVVDRWRRTERQPNAHVGIDLDPAAFFDLLCERIERLG